jgi:hypothetical protein
VKRRTCTPFLLLFAVVSAVAAQDQPDFSGRWILVEAVPADAGTASRLNVTQPIVQTNAVGAPMKPTFMTLTVERAFADRATTETFQIGVEGGTVGGGGFGTRFSVRWEDHRLVMATASYSGSGSESRQTSEHNEVWELDPDGMLIIRITDREAGHGSKSHTLTYRRN